MYIYDNINERCAGTCTHLDSRVVDFQFKIQCGECLCVSRSLFEEVGCSVVAVGNKQKHVGPPLIVSGEKRAFHW